MSDSAQGPGWWLASDGRWYPPELWTGPPQASPQMSQAPGYGQSGYGQSGYGQYGYPPHPMAGGAPAQRPSTNGFAIASLICSCAGIIALGIPSVVGIVFGFLARSRIRQSYGIQRGDGLALAGIIVGFAVVGLVILGLVVDATHSRTGQ
ncbi:MAG TPA: DUF4190 domain-containing protein [Acidimicrobiales bacterium]